MTALLDISSLNYVAPMARSVLGSIRPIDALLAAFETGDGVPYAADGDDLHEGQAGFTRPLYEHLLGKEWLPSVYAGAAGFSSCDVAPIETDFWRFYLLTP
jgi:hypothetical protein